MKIKALEERFSTYELIECSDVFDSIECAEAYGALQSIMGGKSVGDVDFKKISELFYFVNYVKEDDIHKLIVLISVRYSPGDEIYELFLRIAGRLGFFWRKQDLVMFPDQRVVEETISGLRSLKGFARSVRINVLRKIDDETALFVLSGMSRWEALFKENKGEYVFDLFYRWARRLLRAYEKNQG